MVKRVIFTITVLVALASIAATSVSARVTRQIDDNDTVLLRGNVHHKARPEFDRGATEPTLPMERMVLAMRLAADKQATLEKFLAEQHDQTSDNFHRWLTPEEFGERFGPKVDDIKAITGWLTAHGFTVEEVSRGRSSINFSGSVATVEHAFRTKMRNYSVEGHLRHANAVDPSIPRGLADLVGGIVSLHNIPKHSMSAGIRPIAPLTSQPEYNNGGSHYMTPGDFANIYNLKPLYDVAIDGTGVTIAIVGRCNIHISDVQTFRQRYGLPAKDPVIVLNGPDPGVWDFNEEGEAILDVEWSGGVAKNATIKHVVSKSTMTDGVDLSAQYIVNNNLAPVMSTSFGSCEAQMTLGENAFYNSLWQQAAAQGITSFVSTGDSGAAGCDPADAPGALNGLGVNGLASTPYNVAVGGTKFDDGAGGYWNPTNGTDGSSAIGYIPEVAWNESGSVSGGNGLWSTGGGSSALYAKPSWQVSPGVPGSNNRYVPDVSLTAAIHDGYTIFQRDQYPDANYFSWAGGTSASSPSFAGIMALIVQKTGQRQGNANIAFYRLANAQYGLGSVAVFHDTTAGNNSVPGLTGYSSTSGYDLATGLGSVDANALAGNWDLATSPTVVSTTPASGATGVAAATAVAALFSQSMTAATINALTFTLSGATGIVTYDPATHTATLTPSSALAPGTVYTATITTGVTNAAGIPLSAVKTWSFTTSAPPAITTPNPLPGGAAVIPYSFALNASGGIAPYAWSIASGSLPPGLTLNPATGVVGGTPTATGVFSLGIRVTDAVGTSAIKPLSLTVSATACGNWPVRIAGATPVSYPDVLSVYPLAADNSLIQLQALDFSGDFLLDRDLRIKLDGGYNCGYSANAGATGLLGMLRVKNGTVNVGNLRLK